jgi:hypothetical protein
VNHFNPLIFFVYLYGKLMFYSDKSQLSERVVRWTGVLSTRSLSSRDVDLVAQKLLPTTGFSVGRLLHHVRFASITVLGRVGRWTAISCVAVDAADSYAAVHPGVHESARRNEGRHSFLGL